MVTRKLSKFIFIISFLFATVLFISFANSSQNTYFSNEIKVSNGEILKLIGEKISENAVFEEEIGNGVFIEPEIYKQLEEKDKVMVIVWLKRDLYSYNIDEIKKRVRENQDRVLEALNNVEKDITGEEVAEEQKGNFELVYRYEVLNGFAGKINKNGLEILENNENVEAVYAERILHTTLQQSLPLINATQVWPIQVSSGNLTGTGQTVCIVDTGIDYTHPALGGCLGTNCKVRGGFDFINNDSNPIDDNGHGTHVAGIVAANSNTIKGVAPNASLIAVKVCNATGNSCPNTAIAAGVDYCVSNMNSLGTDIITMSIGDGGQYNSGTCPQWLDSNLSLATFLNIPVTVASGNEGYKNGISYPACSPNAISVGAVYDANVGSQTWCTQRNAQGNCTQTCTDSTTKADNVTCFSNSGSNLDLMAHGAIITSTALGGGVVDMSGTSMAAPHVAGTIALMKQSMPSLSPFQIENILKQNGRTVADNGNGLNFSRINALASVNYLSTVVWGDDRRLTFNSAISLLPDISTDAQGNTHITWYDDRDGNNEIYYEKLDNNGNTLINDRRLTFNSFNSYNPALSTDIQGNTHITWYDNRDGNNEIYYEKLDNNGNTLINDRRLTFASADSWHPSISTDIQGNVYLAWEDNRNGNIEIYYEKLDNNGNTLINDTRLTFNIADSWTPSITTDTQENMHIVWYDTRDGNYEIYYEKLDNNGNTLINDRRLTFNSASSWDPTIVTDAQGNIHIVWFDNRNGNYEIYYEKLDNNGNTLINDRRLTFNSAISYYPIISTDAQGNIHIVWQDYRDGNFEIYYKKGTRTLSYIGLSGNPQPGNTIQFNLNDALSANSPYIFGLTLGTSPGIPLPTGQTIPLNADALLLASINSPSSIGLSNNFGNLNSSGQATVSLAVPNISGLSGLTVYGGFITANNQGQIISISDPIPITIT